MTDNERPSSYQIMINDTQRAIFIAALRLLRANADAMSQLTVSPIYPETLEEEVDLLVSMLDDLPNVERESPGVLHGFCF
jgi:hypothetical protein